MYYVMCLCSHVSTSQALLVLWFHVEVEICAVLQALVFHRCTQFFASQDFDTFLRAFAEVLRRIPETDYCSPLQNDQHVLRRFADLQV